MKIALIPPKGYEYEALKGTAIMSLCIPSYYGSAVWSTTARNAGRDRLHILDNGAAEGEMADIERLLEYGARLQVNEMVMPDILGDGEGTLLLADRFFRESPTAVDKFDWMGVLQGQNEEEMMKIALRQVRNEQVKTLGIPRIYISNTHQLNARIDLANKIESRFPRRFQIHFLGVHPAWPGEIRAAVNYAGVRSLDTSLPFNATIEGIELNDKTRLVCRPKAYFTDQRELDRNLLNRNIQTVKEWASGKRASTTAPAS